MSGNVNIPEIVIRRDGVEIRRCSLQRSPIGVGRDPENDVVLDHPSIAEQHAVIVRASGQWWIRCLAGDEGLQVAGGPSHGHAFEDGDCVGVGPFELIFHVSGRAEPPLQTDLAHGQTRVFDAAESLDVHGGRSAGPGFDIPGYQIGGEVGRGGMGRVFEAVQLSTRRTVALKIMLEGPYTNETAKRRFEREVQIAASLRHANIAQIYESGLHEGRYWFAMEFVEGVPLDAPELKSRLSHRDRLSLMATICQAVGSAHDRMVVHRDLKPTNILISADGQPHILDFGLAKVADPAGGQDMMLSIAGELMGTPAYMSPEQTERDSSRVDARADVYALGVILYQLLTGQFPYDVRGRLDEVIRNIATTDPTRPSQISRDVDSEVEAIILKAIAKHPDQRYASAGAMGEDLQRLLAGEPIEAKLASRSYVLSKTVARNRKRMLAGAVLAGAVISSVLVTRALLRPRADEAPRDGVRASLGGPSTAPAGGDLGPPTTAPLSAASPSVPVAPPSTAAVASPMPEPVEDRPIPATSPTSAPVVTKESRAEAWLARLADAMDRGDYLRARLALERLEARFADVRSIAESSDRLKAFAERIDAKLARDAVRDEGACLVQSPPPNTADWQAAMAIAQEIVAGNADVGIVVARVLLENDATDPGFDVRGQGLRFYGGEAVATHRGARSGDHLFIGSADRNAEGTGITISAARHQTATIALRPKHGEVVRLGDVMVRADDDASLGGARVTSRPNPR